MKRPSVDCTSSNLHGEERGEEGGEGREERREREREGEECGRQGIGEGGRGRRERNFVIEMVVAHGCTVCN